MFIVLYHSVFIANIFSKQFLKWSNTSVNKLFETDDDLFLCCSDPSREAVCTILKFMKVFGMIQPGREPATYSMRGWQANSCIFADLGFLCIRSLGLPCYDYEYFIITSSGIQWVVSLLQWLTKLGVLNVFHYATMNNKTCVKLKWRCFKSWSLIGCIKSSSD